MSPRTSRQSSNAVRKIASEWIARRDAGLSPAEESEFQAWRAADPRHAEACARYERLWSNLDRPRSAGASDQLTRDLALLHRRDRRRRARLVKTAGFVGSIFALTWWLSVPNPPTVPVATEQIVVTAPVRRVLADGTVVEHPAGSAIAVDFGSPGFRRITLLRGEAHFQVAKNPARPFVVRAGSVDIEAVGTAFSVQFTDSSVEVLVTEGRVAVDQTPPAAAGTPGEPDLPPAPAPTFVDAGYRLSAELKPAASRLAHRIEAISPAEVDQRFIWRSARIESSNTPLHEVVAAINRHAAERGGVQFRIEDPSLAEVRLSGVFRVDDASVFVAILENGFGVEAERAAEQLIVLRKRP